MRLRKLEKKDAVYMLEWMKEPDTQWNFQRSFVNMTLNNCEEFIENSDVAFRDGANADFAIVNEKDEYMGTISLKNIDLVCGKAEYAISMRKSARGTGIASDATNQLLKVAFDEWGMRKVYLNVSEKNQRAISFYEKMGFSHEGTFRKHICINNELIDLRWYSMLKEEYEVRR